MQNVFKMKRHWFVERTTNIIIKGCNKDRNKIGTKTKLEHNQMTNGNKSANSLPGQTTDSTYKLISKV